LKPNFVEIPGIWLDRHGHETIDRKRRYVQVKDGNWSWSGFEICKADRLVFIAHTFQISGEQLHYVTLSNCNILRADPRKDPRQHCQAGTS